MFVKHMMFLIVSKNVTVSKIKMTSEVKRVLQNH